LTEKLRQCYIVADDPCFMDDNAMHVFEHMRFTDETRKTHVPDEVDDDSSLLYTKNVKSSDLRAFHWTRRLDNAKDNTKVNYEAQIGSSKAEWKGQWEYKPVSFKVNIDDPQLSVEEKATVEQLLHTLTQQQGKNAQQSAQLSKVAGCVGALTGAAYGYKSKGIMRGLSFGLFGGLIFSGVALVSTFHFDPTEAQRTTSAWKLEHPDLANKIHHKSYDPDLILHQMEIFKREK